MTGHDLRRFFVDRLDSDRADIDITGQDAHHIRAVLRLRAGDALVLIDMDGNRAKGRIAALGREGVRVILEGVLPSRPAPRAVLTLCQACLRAQKMELVIQKATELGVSRIIPFTSQRTVVNIAGGLAPEKLRRWNEIARLAAAQCDRDRPPEVEGPASLAEILHRFGPEKLPKVILFERMAAGVGFKDFMHQAAAAAAMVGVVGPEGGFTLEEISQARDAGFEPIGLGGRILRAETAAIVLAAIVQYEWGDMGCPGVDE